MKLISTLLFLTLFISGCASPPAISYYKLSPEFTPARQPVNKGIRVMIGPVMIPIEIDRPQLVAQGIDGEVQIYQYQRWGGSLKGDIGQVIGSSVTHNLGVLDVLNFSQSTETQFDYQVFIDVKSVEGTPDRDVVIDALWTIKPNPLKIKNIRSMDGRSLVRVPSMGPSIGDLVAAQSRAFVGVGADIARRFSEEGIVQSPPGVK